MENSEIEPGRAHLLRDQRGIYGLAICWPDHKGNIHRRCAIYRPDRLDELDVFDGQPALQQIPGLRSWRQWAEGAIVDRLLTAMLGRTGLNREGSQESGPRWWSEVPVIQHDNRRLFHGLSRKAVRITNSLIRQALAVAPIDALKLARRFSLRKRFAVYQAISRSSRLLQLAEVFPLLAWQIINRDHGEAKRLVEAGAKLTTIASLMKVPMAYRGLKPGAVFSRLVGYEGERPIGDTLAELKHELINAVLPTTTAAQRRWLTAVWQANRIGGPYVEWTARNCHVLGCATMDAAAAQVSDIGDWVRASYVVGIPKHVQRALMGSNDDLGEKYITRPFCLDMSIATVRELSSTWHEVVALSDPETNIPLPPPWRGATKIGVIDVVPLDTAVAIAAEARAMHHCARTLIPKVRRGDSCLYGAREGDQRIATIEVSRSGQEIFIRQMRGACNSIVSPLLQAKLTRWVRERAKWNLPVDTDEEKGLPTCVSPHR